MPESILKLRDICSSVEYGYTASASHDISGPQFLRITDIVPNLIDWPGVPRCQIEDKKLAKFRLHHNDIVIARTGATVGYAKRLKHPPLSVFASYLVRLKINTKIADPEYVGFIVESSNYKDFVFRNAGGAAQPNANAQVLTSYELRLPELSTQHRIACILSAYDDLIENNTRRIAILEEMARRIYEEWFVHFRFPGHEHVRMVESELGLIPEGWTVCALSDFVAVNAKSINAKNAPSEILYIDIASVSLGAIEQKQPVKFEDAPGRARRIVIHGDVIWSCVRPNRKSFALVLNPEPNLIVSTGFAVLSAQGIPYSYIYFSVTTDAFVSYLTNHATGAAYPAVTVNTFEKATILKPNRHVTDQFHSVVAPMLELYEVLKRKNTNLRTTRDLLLPKLISGELDVSRLPEPEDIAA